MRLATFNVQNLFRRHPSLDAPESGEPGPAAMIQELNALFQKENYSEDDKERMRVLLAALELLGRHGSSRICRLRVNRGKLIDKTRIVANGRQDWVGWVEQKRSLVEQLPIQMTARVIHETQADVLAVQEVESREALLEFNASYLRLDDKSKQATHRTTRSTPRYKEVMVIEGNDKRGINVGLMTRPGYTMSYMRSHAQMGYPNQGGEIFSRDCAEYLVITPEKQQLWLLVNHFKSKKGGGDAKRHDQALAVRGIYERLKSNRAYIAIVGDLNDSDDSAALAPLLGSDSGLRSARAHEKFVDDYPGTFGSCSKQEQFDYILLSEALYDKVQAGGVNRNGLWGGKSRGAWPCYPEITSPALAASDHAAVWVDLDLA